MAYSKKVLEHYENPQNVGTLDINKQEVGTGLVGAPECGDVMRLQIQVHHRRVTRSRPGAPGGDAADHHASDGGCGGAVHGARTRGRGWQRR